MPYTVDTSGRYLYKQAGYAFTVAAKVIEVKGAQFKIEFINPKGGHRHRRWLRTSADRARFEPSEKR